jgi:hypothetical protein
MVRAVLAGVKTQTRRALRVQPPANTVAVSTWHHPDPRPHFYAWVRDGAPDLSALFGGAEISDEWGPMPCHHGAAGDRLWGREAFSGPRHQERHPPRDWHSTDPIHYWADGNPARGDWTKPRPGMFMPRWASRLTLEVVAVRVERLNEISVADAIAEGIPRGGPENPDGIERVEYRRLWESLNGAGSWDANPWVWCVEFRRAP